MRISTERIVVRPTLIVGLGGTGVIVCQWVEEYIRQLLGGVPSFVRFLKIDTDGMETSVIKGAAESLRRFHPSLLFEIGPANLSKNGSSADELLDLLAGLGYIFCSENSLKPLDDVKNAVSRIVFHTTINLVAVLPSGPDNKH